MNKKEKLFALHRELCEKALEVMKSKNQDYTGAKGQEADPYANFRGSELFAVAPEIGLMIRMGDKMQRIAAFIRNGTLAVSDETWYDTIVDMINYPVLLAGLLSERVPDGPVKDEDPIPVDVRKGKLRGGGTGRRFGKTAMATQVKQVIDDWDTLKNTVVENERKKLRGLLSDLGIDHIEITNLFARLDGGTTHE